MQVKRILAIGGCAFALASPPIASAGRELPITSSRGHHIAQHFAAHHLRGSAAARMFDFTVYGCANKDRYHVICHVDYEWSDGGGCRARIKVWESTRFWYQDWTSCKVYD